MTFSSTDVPRSRFRLGEALESTFGAVFAHFGVFVMLALAIFALPTLLLTLPFGPATAAADPLPRVGVSVARTVLNLALTAILQGALVRGVVTHLNGGRPTFAGCLRGGLSSGAALVAIGLMAGIGIAFGFLLLIVPGLFLITLWAVVGPAQVIERRGVLTSFSRSADLTSGHRWAILAAFLIMFVLVMIATVIGSAIAGVIAVLLLGATVSASMSWPFFLVVTTIGTLATAVGSVFSSALPAALYYHLRRAKEGAAPAQLAAVFD